MNRRIARKITIEHFSDYANRRGYTKRQLDTAYEVFYKEKVPKYKNLQSLKQNASPEMSKRR